MATLFLICAVVGGTVIVCQFLMTLLGLGGGHDGGGGHDFGHDTGVGGHDIADGHSHEVTHDQESSWFVGMLTFRTLTAAVAFFGLGGLIAGPNLDELATLGVALAAGVAALFLVGWLMKGLGRLNLDGTLRIERAVGTTGTVYLTIPGERGGIGRVIVDVQQRSAEFKAITAQRSLPTGTRIRVTGVATADTLEVVAAEETVAAQTLSK